MRRMARFRSVDFYPFEGFPDRMWGPAPEGPGEPVADAFLRAARPVVALDTQALTGGTRRAPGGGGIHEDPAALVVTLT